MRSDRDRVLMNIAVAISSTPWDKFEPLRGGWNLRIRFDRPVAQFVPTEMTDVLDMPVQKGDIVKCNTNPHHEWGIAELVDRCGDHWKLKLIGGERVLRMYNESFEVLRFIQPHLVLTGLHYKIYGWCHKAFQPRYNDAADGYMIRCGGVLVGDGEATIWERPHAFSHEKLVDGGKKYVVPRKHVIAFNTKTRLRDIVSELKAGGFGGSFDYGDEPSTEGMAGCVRITRDDLIDAIPELAHSQSANKDSP